MQGELVNTWDATGLSKESLIDLGVHAESEDLFDCILIVGVVQEASVSPLVIFELLALSTLDVCSNAMVIRKSTCYYQMATPVFCIVERLKAPRRRVSGTTDCAFFLPRGVLCPDSATIKSRQSETDFLI